MTSPSDEIFHHSDLMMPTTLFGLEPSRPGDVLKTLDVGFDRSAKFGRRRQIRKRTRTLEPLFDGVSGQHLFHRVVKPVDDRLWRTGRKHETVPAEVGDSRHPALGKRRNGFKSRPTVRRGNRDQSQVA